MNGEPGHAGVPPFVRFETITPCGRGDDTRLMPETGDPPETSNPLYTDVHHLPTYNDGIALPTIAEQTRQVVPEPTYPPRGRGSANQRPTSRLYASRVARATRKSAKRQRWKLRAWNVLYASTVVVVAVLGCWPGFLAWAFANDPTPIPLKAVTPVLALAAVGFWLTAALLWAAWWFWGRR